MRRDDCDLFLVLPQHVAIHERAENWARWQRTGRAMSYILPMFRLYRDGYYEHAETPTPVDERDALKVQKAFANLPERHRHVIGWAYAKPWIPVHIVCRLLAVRRSEIPALLNDGRSMLKNTCAKPLTGIGETV